MTGPQGIALVGPRAAGKSTLGAALATAGGLHLVDTDLALADRAGMPAGEFLRTAGEPAFRRLEEQVVLAALAAADQHVLALGGGAVLSPMVRAELARPRLLTVFVRAPVPVLLERLRGQERQRPRLLPVPLACEVATLWAERLPLWRAVADHEVDTAVASPAAIVAELLALWRHRRSGV